MPTVTRTYRVGLPAYLYVSSWNAYNGFAYPTSWQPARTNVAFSNTKTGINLPGWRSRISNTLSATTDFSGTKVRYVTQPFAYEVNHRLLMGNGAFGPWVYKGEGYGTSAETPHIGQLSPSSSTAENTALIQLYKKIRKEHQHFSGLTFLGELRESIKMIRRPALALRKGLDTYVSTLRRRTRGIPNPRKTRTLGRDANTLSDYQRDLRKRILSDTWLEFSFGWSPLIAEMRKAAETIARFDMERTGSISRKARCQGVGYSHAAEYSSTLSPMSLTPFGSNLVPHLVHRKIYGERTIRYIVGLNYTTSIPSGSAGRLAELSGFRLAEFVPTAWELIPWSFLFDYFSNVGDILEAFATPTNNIYFINKTVRVSTSTYYRSRLDTQRLAGISTCRGYKEGASGAGMYDVEHTSFTRTGVPVGNLALPKFQLENPFGSNPVRRLLNMTSLAAGMKTLKPFF